MSLPSLGETKKPTNQSIDAISVRATLPFLMSTPWFLVATLKWLRAIDEDSVNTGYSDMQSNWIKQADGSLNGLPSSNRSKRSRRSSR
jgi:hypothetical protein